MAFPRNLLNEHEELVLDLKPHWMYLAKSGITLAVALILGIFVLAGGPDGTIGDGLRIVVGLGVLVALGWFARTYAQWATTMFVLTTDRIISRRGFLHKEGTEIPLERINTVFFHQRIFERMVGAGDLTIESAGERGSETFSDVRRPSVVQKEIYVQMEENENRMRRPYVPPPGGSRRPRPVRTSRSPRDRAGTDPAGAAGRGRHRCPDRQARRPARPRRHHRRGVRVQEGRPARSHVSEQRSGSSAWFRRSPRRCWRGASCPRPAPGSASSPDCSHVGGTKNPDVDAIVALRPSLVVMCDEENRREDADALTTAGLAVHSCSPRSVADVSPALDALADRLTTVGVTPVWSAEGLPTLPSLGLRVFVPIWRRPWMSLAGDTYGSSVLDAIGVGNVFADAASRYPTVDARRRGPTATRRRPGALGALHVPARAISPSSRRWRRSSRSTDRTSSGGAPAHRPPSGASTPPCRHAAEPRRLDPGRASADPAIRAAGRHGAGTLPTCRSVKPSPARSRPGRGRRRSGRVRTAR